MNVNNMLPKMSKLKISCQKFKDYWLTGLLHLALMKFAITGELELSKQVHGFSAPDDNFTRVMVL